DGLDGDAAGRNHLTTGAARGRGERCRPSVLVDEHTGDGAGFHRFGKVLDVVGGEDLGDARLDRTEVVEFVEVVDLERIDGAVLILGDDDEVQHLHDPRVHEFGQFGGHFAGEVLVAWRELDHEVVDGSEFVHLAFHGHLPSEAAGRGTNHPPA